MCGRNVAQSNFDPDSLDLDVQTTRLVGLGKGRGFRSTGHGSILGQNEICLKVKDRCLDLLELFVNHGVATLDQIGGRFGLVPFYQINAEGDETQALREEMEVRDQKLDDLCLEIADALGESPDDYPSDDEDGDEQYAKLRYLVRRALDEFTAMRENQIGGDN